MSEEEVSGSQLNLDMGSIHDIERRKRELSPPFGMLASSEDFLSGSGDNLFNGQFVDAFYEQVAVENNRNVLCINSYTFESLMQGQVKKHVVQKMLQNDSFMENDVILMLYILQCRCWSLGSHWCTSQTAYHCIL